MSGPWALGFRGLALPVADRHAHKTAHCGFTDFFQINPHEAVGISL